MVEKRVLYFANSLERIRVFETFKDDPEIEQLFVGPKPQVFGGVVEDYSGFKMTNIKTYNNNKEAESIVNSFSPDIIVQSDIVSAVKFPKTAKRVFVSHGVYGNHVRDHIPKSTGWSGFDLYCGSTSNSIDVVNHFTGGVDRNKILLNSLPQLDLFHKSNYTTFDRASALAKTKNPNAKKVILFCGFSGKYRSDFYEHNEDYYRTLFELAKISSKNNWLSMIKSRQGLRQTEKFLALDEPWIKNCRKPHSDAKNNKFIHFIHPDNRVYKYFFADVIVCNGCSTVEVEASLAHKPLIVVRTKSDPSKYDPFESVTYGASTLVNDISMLEDAIINGLTSSAHIEKQNAFIKGRGIIADGLAYKRINDRLKLL